MQSLPNARDALAGLEVCMGNISGVLSPVEYRGPKLLEVKLVPRGWADLGADSVKRENN